MSEMILYDVNQAVQQVKNTKLIVSEMARDVLVKDIDYGIVPGATKPTLFKPGAERLCTAFGLCPEFEPISQIEDFEKGIFYYRYRCSLIHIASGKKVATGIGSCNSKEDKYRWRNEECPNCHKQKILKSKFPDRNTGEIGWYCGACKSNFPADVFTGKREENTDPFSIINTLDKMAQKRALVAAVLIGTNASEFFTQDVEDLPRFNDEDVIEADFVEPSQPAPQPPARAKNAPTASEKPQGDAPELAAPDLTARTPDELKTWLAARVQDGKGATQGAIATGQQKNIAIAMSDYFKVETVRRDFLNYMMGVDSYAKLNERQFLTLKKWLNETDPAQIVKEIAAFTAMQQTAEEEFAAI